MSFLSNKKPERDISRVQLEKLLLSSDDEKAMLANFVVLIGCTLKKYMPFFAKFGGLQCHITHKFSTNMSNEV